MIHVIVFNGFFFFLFFCNDILCFIFQIHHDANTWRNLLSVIVFYLLSVLSQKKLIQHVETITVNSLSTFLHSHSLFIFNKLSDCSLTNREM